MFDASDKHFTSTGWPTLSGCLAGAVRISAIRGSGTGEISGKNCSSYLGDAIVLTNIGSLRYSMNGSAMSFSPSNLKRRGAYLGR